jgi:hypothetical protein
MQRLLLLSLLLINSAFATNLEEVCQNATNEARLNAPVFGNNLIAYRIGSSYVLKTMEGTTIFSDSTPIKDVLVKDDSIWILNPFDILEINFKGEIKSTFSLVENRVPSVQALSFTINGDNIIIAQGLGGVTAFDTISHSIKWHTTMSEVPGGMPVTVATDGKVGYAVMATSAQGGFAGVATFNLTNGSVTKISAYNRNYGVIDTQAKASWYNNNLIINNGGWIHVLTKEQLHKGRPVRPRWVAHVIKANGPVQQHYMVSVGEFFIEENSVVGCGLYTTQENGQYTQKSALFKTVLP